MPTKDHRHSTAMMGIHTGSRIVKKNVISLAPSTSAASRSSVGMPW